MTTTSPTETNAAELEHQEQLLTFLLNPQSYPHRPRTVRGVQTHPFVRFI